MKTSVVAARGKDGTPIRAFAPGEDPNPAPKPNEWPVYPTPKFKEAHSYEAKEYASIAHMAKGIGRRVTRHVPDMVGVGSHSYALTRGVCDHVRFMPPDVVELVDRLDLEIAHLIRERNAALEDGYARGRKLRKVDLVPDTAPATGEKEGTK